MTAGLAAEAILSILALPALAAALYLGVLTLFSRRAPSAPADRAPDLRFEIVIPAHDEEAGISATVASARALDYPPERFGTTVVADNCHDATSARALEAGARVLVRDDPARRGKGFALAFAFDRILAEGKVDAIVVVDADTVIDPGLLRAFAARLARGAWAVQADNAVLNPDDSWRTRLMAIALGAIHRLRFSARERLGLSCGLRGNGMCLSARLLRELPHDVSSRTEDLEYSLRVTEAGHRVHYAGEAHVFSAMVSAERSARSQRRRWEGGRRELARRRGPALLWRAVVRRDAMLLDAALDLLVPPLAQLAAAIATGLLLAAILAAVDPARAPPLILWATSAAAVGAYVLRGWALSGTGAAGMLDLVVHAPAYAVWKLALKVRPDRTRPTDWIRTDRE